MAESRREGDLPEVPATERTGAVGMGAETARAITEIRAAGAAFKAAACSDTDGLAEDGVTNQDPARDQALEEASATRIEKERTEISHNSYFKGAVQSLGHIDAEGRNVTNGTMKVGSYKFSTSAELAEEIFVQDGELHLVLSEGAVRAILKAGNKFPVPAGVEFTAIAITPVEYRCVYIPVQEASQ